MTAPSWWPFQDEDVVESGHPVRCVKCGQPTWRKLDDYTGVHRGCEEAEEVARL